MMVRYRIKDILNKHYNIKRTVECSSSAILSYEILYRLAYIITITGQGAVSRNKWERRKTSANNNNTLVTKED